MSYYPNWDAEAERISKAFEIEIKVQFYWGPLVEGRILVPVLPPTPNAPRIRPTIILNGGFELQVSYDSDIWNDGRLFEIIKGKSSLSILIDWNGDVNETLSSKPISQFEEFEIAQKLAKGLQFLDLLTPEVEGYLFRDVTSHQKLEWLLELEEKSSKPETPKPVPPKIQQPKENWIGFNAPNYVRPPAPSSSSEGLFQSMRERLRRVLGRL